MGDTKSPRIQQNLSPLARWAALTVGLAVILVLLLMLFIMPALKSGPTQLPVGIVGASTFVAEVETAVEVAQPGAFNFEVVGTEAELLEGIEARQFVGGLSITSGSIRTFVASAGSTALSGTVTALGSSISGQLNLAQELTDVVPLPDTDRSGVGIGGLAFPLVFGGIVPVAAFRTVLANRRDWILGGILGFSIIGGLVVAAVLRFMFGSITHSVIPVAGAVALGIAALALPLAGLNDFFGAKGFTLGAMLMMFIANPFAGIATGASWLPDGVAVIGQILPPGAAGTLVRSVAYFDGAGGGAAAVTLSVWVLAGAVLYLVAPVARRRSSQSAETALSSEPHPAHA